MPDLDLLDSLVGRAVPAVLDRRSVHLLLEELWHVNRAAFWHRMLVLMRDTTPGLSRTVAAQSVVNLARSADDLSPLFSALNDDGTSNDARRAIRFISGFIASDPSAIEPAVCLGWALTGATSTDEVVRGSLAGMVHHILLRRKDLGARARSDAAAFARTLLSTALDRNTPTYAVGLVIDTVSFDANENLTSLRALIAATCEHPDREEALDHLSREVDNLFGDPRLVGSLYERAIKLEADEQARERAESLRWYEEARTADAEGREIPRSPIRARRDRDIEHSLQEHATKFIERAPLVAGRVIVDGLLYRDAVTRERAPETITLTLGGRSFVVPEQEPGRVLEGMDLIERLAADLVNTLGNVGNDVRNQLVDLLVSLPAPVSLWSAIIESAGYEPLLRGIALELVSTPEALRLFSHAAAALIRGWGSALPAEVRDQLASTAAKLVVDSDKYARARIEAALAPRIEAPQEGAARAPEDLDADDLDEDVVAIDVPLDDEDVFDMSRFKLTREDLRTAANTRLREAKRRARVEEKRLEAFLQNKKAPSESIETDAAVAAIRELRSALEEKDAHPAFVVTGWCTLSRTASLIAMNGDDGATALIFESAARNDAMPWNGDGSFIDLLNAGQVFVRAEAVRGLIALAIRGDERALSEIERLGKDVEPAVRFQVAWRLNELSELDLQRVWPLLERLLDDSVSGVVEAAVRQLRAFFAKDRDRCLLLGERVLARLSSKHESENGARTDLLLQLSWYHLARGEEVSTRAMERVLLDLPRTTAGLGRLLHSYRSWLTMGAEGEEPEASARNRTIALFKRIAAGCIEGMRAETAHDPNARQRTERGDHAQLLEHLAYQLYFASGAFRDHDGEDDLPVESVARFYVDVKDMLLEIGLAGSNSVADKALDTLEHFFRVSRDTDRIPSRDVLNAFVAIAEAMIRDGAAENVWLLDPVEKVLRRCVAERDPSLYDEMMLGSWGRILDPLLERGWQQAFRLARDLDVTR